MKNKSVWILVLGIIFITAGVGLKRRDYIPFIV